MAELVTAAKLKPKKRPGTKTFLDVPLELREKDLNSPSGKWFLANMPATIGRHFTNAILHSGIESADALAWLDYVTSRNNNGKLISAISHNVRSNPFDPTNFQYLYGEQDIPTTLDAGYVLSAGAHGIYLRLQSIIDRLPGIISRP